MPGEPVDKGKLRNAGSPTGEPLSFATATRAITCVVERNFLVKIQKSISVFPNLLQENAVLGEETISLSERSVYNWDQALVESRTPR
jgi:hypothetical protein